MCFSCNYPASIECRDCFKENAEQIFNLETSTYCTSCFNQLHKHPKKRHHDSIEEILLPKEWIEMEQPLTERHRMDLFAVVCIERSHYVAFVKTGNAHAPWCFFDSMADRRGGESGYNIPELFPELNISELEKDVEHNFENISSRSNRLLSDAYICMYKDQKTAMYR